MSRRSELEQQWDFGWAMWTEEDFSWRDRAACKGHDRELFFEEHGKSTKSVTGEAKRICAGCPVKEPCLEYALRSQMVVGTWGGTSGRDRRRIRRERKQAQATTEEKTA